MEPAEVIRRMQERIDREPREDVGLFWSATGFLMGLRYRREEIKGLLRGVRGMKESSFYQMILEEGEAKGLARGKVEEARRILFRQGKRRFGPPDPETVAVIESIGQSERIEVLLDRLLDVSNRQELLASSPEGE
jgi:predicted transposase YdaD